MKYKLILIAAVVTIVTSCQKVTDLNLRTAPPKYIIEGNVTNLPGPYTVTLSRTTPFNTSWQFQGVGGATVTVSDNMGNSETLQESQTGVYQTTGLSGVEGRTYALHITVGDQTFTASSTIPHQVEGPIRCTSLLVTRLSRPLPPWRPR